MKIYFTSDSHNNLFGGLARVATSIEKGKDTLVIDGGDSFIGSPLDYYTQDRKLSYYPQARMFRRMGLDIAVPGNHDFDHGYEGFVRFFSETGARLLCANLVDRRGAIEINRHLIYSFDGLRIGFTALITDYLPRLEKRENLEGFEILPALKCAVSELEYLRANCDVTVLIYHGGFETSPLDGSLLSATSEHIGYRLLTTLSYDLVLTAHQHIVVPFMKVGNSYTVQCGFNAEKYCEIEIDRDGIRGELKTPRTDIREDEIYRDYRSWLDTEIGRLPADLGPYEPKEVLTSGCGIADLVNHIQLEATGADISCTSAFNTTAYLPRTVTYRELLKCFPFPNQLAVKEVDRDTLKLALEISASFLERSDGNVVISRRYLEPLCQLFNYDIYQGIEYAFDLNRPVGERVVDLSVPKEKMKLVMSDYRAGGNGGYSFFRDIPNISVTTSSIQDMLFAHFRKNKETAWPRSGFKGVR